MEFTEKQIAEIIKFYKEEENTTITREEAIEVLTIENNAKQCRRYEKADSKERKKPKPKPLDNEKVATIQTLFDRLTDFENVTIKNPQREITFTIGDNEYSIVLTRHRKK